MISSKERYVITKKHEKKPTQLPIFDYFRWTNLKKTFYSQGSHACIPHNQVVNRLVAQTVSPQWGVLTARPRFVQGARSGLRVLSAGAHFSWFLKILAKKNYELSGRGRRSRENFVDVFTFFWDERLDQGLVEVLILWDPQFFFFEDLVKLY